ncbi:MAG: DNRLRE domain-containing protein [Candidatus Bathyarchaeia archaeon]|jgi:hypothetical protein
MKSKRALFLILVLVTSTLATQAISLAHAQAGAVTLNPKDNTYVDSLNPDLNYGGQNYLEISNWNFLSDTYEDIVWLKFDLSTVPDGAVVDMATLQLYTSMVDETFNVHAYSCSNNSWTELTLTYSNMPSYNTTSMDSVPVATNNQWYNWSVVDAVRNALNNNPKSVTIVMQEPTRHSSSTSVWFTSKESSTDYVPKLTIHWKSVMPGFPTFLAGALLVSLFIIIILVASIYYRKKHISQSNQRSRDKRTYVK